MTNKEEEQITLIEAARESVNTKDSSVQGGHVQLSQQACQSVGPLRGAYLDISVSQKHGVVRYARVNAPQ